MSGRKLSFVVVVVGVGVGVISLAGIVPSAFAQSYADRVFHDAKIVTMDASQPSASALAIHGDTIVAIGAFEEVEPWIGDETSVHDLGGRTVIPGINESHIHVRDLGFQQHYAVNLEEALSVSDVQRLLQERLESLDSAEDIHPKRRLSHLR